mmetsp:Transcript_31344/g.68838  ORF Transcript_31344/g.68838 Transcript_31344/m.68838 type:complete len:114 (-) Transcript_31344:67-408(-)
MDTFSIRVGNINNGSVAGVLTMIRGIEVEIAELVKPLLMIGSGGKKSTKADERPNPEYSSLSAQRQPSHLSQLNLPHISMDRERERVDRSYEYLYRYSSNYLYFLESAEVEFG